MDAKREHWMQLTENSEASTLLIACGPTSDQNGYAEAEAALADTDARAPQRWAAMVEV